MRILTLLALAGMICVSESLAQEKNKEKPKPPARIAIRDVAEAKKDLDFAIQGEYVGKDPKEGPLAAQVIARGNGKFQVRILTGGLPGAGWDGKTQKRGSAHSDNGSVVLDGGLEGTISNGTLTYKGIALKQVHRTSETLGKKAPEGATVLFAQESDVDKWNDAQAVKLSDGTFLACKPGKNILSKATFKNFNMHLEFRLAWMPNSNGQGRSNSGLYLQNHYECQILDSFGLKGENNECGGFYTQYAPLVNMCLPPLTWQTYDIEFTAAVFDENGKRIKPARATVYHNGVKVQDNVELKGPTPGGSKEENKPGPIHLQWHGDPLIYNNIWVKEQ